MRKAKKWKKPIGSSPLTTLNLKVCELELIAKAPNKKGYPKKLRTLGDYLKGKRLEENLSVERVCDDLQILSSTLHRWENNRTRIQFDNQIKIINYLGFNPIIK